MDISAIAKEFIDINERRKELEKREEYLRGVLVQHFQATGTKQLETERGKVSYVEAQKVDYDVPLLRHALPPPVFDLVARVSINDSVLSQLVRDGKVDPAAVERAKKVTHVYRVVAQARPLAAATPATPVEPAGPAERGEPAVQAGPVEPGPAGSSKRARPAGPAKPAKPDKPAQPAKPAEPAKAAKPATPAEPATPATPATPAIPATPAV
ncbi:MAG: hypothetical protein ACM3ZO_03430, partial [Clostridia bacterium]